MYAVSWESTTPNLLMEQNIHWQKFVVSIIHEKLLHVPSVPTCTMSRRSLLESSYSVLEMLNIPGGYLYGGTEEWLGYNQALARKASCKFAYSLFFFLDKCM